MTSRRRVHRTIYAMLGAATVVAALGVRAHADDPAKILKSMSDHLAGQKTLSASFDSDIEIITPVRRWMEPNFPDITHWSEMEKGGHFAAFEQPELFVRDVRKFFATVR